MRFLFLSAYNGLGGGETIQLSLAKELARRGYEAHLFVREEGDFAAAWRKQGQRAHVLPFHPVSSYFLPAISARSAIVPTMAHLLDDEMISILHSDYHSLPYAAAAARKMGVPCIWTCQGWWFHPKPWQRAFFHNIDLHFAVSAAARRGFLGQPPFMPERRMSILHPGVDTEHFRPAVDKPTLRQRIRQQYGFSTDSALILHVARFQDVKGHDTFQEIARIVAANWPKARFLVAGENLQRPADATYMQRILATTQNDPLLKERLVYAGFVSEIQQLYAAADIAVCPSRFESYGMANLEAMACGIPVVSSRRGGPTETVREGTTGYLLSPRDATGYAQRILSLLQDERQREQMGTNARRHVMTHFTVEQSTERFIKACQSLTMA